MAAAISIRGFLAFQLNSKSDRSCLLVLRLVQRFTDSTDGGSLSPNDTGYVVVENNSLDVQNEDSGRYTVRVARIWILFQILN